MRCIGCGDVYPLSFKPGSRRTYLRVGRAETSGKLLRSQPMMVVRGTFGRKVRQILCQRILPAVVYLQRNGDVLQRRGGWSGIQNNCSCGQRRGDGWQRPARLLCHGSR